MRILIAGGFGYIGGRLAQTLNASGHTLALGSRCHQPAPSWLPTAITIKMNWDSHASLEQSCSTYDVVIQAAGMNAQDCAANPVAAAKFNGEATAHLLESAIKVGVKRFIYLSTAHVYKSPLVGFINEKTPTLNTHAYASSHLLGEQAVLQMTDKRLIDGVALRITNGLGAPVSVNTNCWSLLVCDLCKQVVETGDIRLSSPGTHQRDFIPMTDICNTISYISSHPSMLFCDTPLNLSSGTSMTVIDMARLIKKRAQATLLIDPQIIVPDGLKSATPTEQLSISNAKLQKISAVLKHNINDEIDKLLKFCVAQITV